MKRAMIAIMALIWILISTGKIGVADSKFICVVHRGEWVWVREAPDKDAAKIDTIRYGIECQVSEIVNRRVELSSNRAVSSIRTETVPPGCVNFTEFPRILIRTCFSFMSSPI